MEAPEAQMLKNRADMFFSIFANNYILAPTKFCVLRTSVNKETQFNIKSVAVNYNNATKNIEIFGMDPIPIVSGGNCLIQDISWGKIGAGNKEKRFIKINFKNNKQPLIIHGKEREMNIWYDSLRKILDPDNGFPETKTCTDLVDDITYGLQFSEENDIKVPEVPPPPKDQKF